MKDRFTIEIDMEQKMCGICKKSSTEYYELKLHLRFKYFNDINKIKEKAYSLLEKNFSDKINKLDELDNGFDIYFRTHGEMPKIFRIFNKYFLCEEKKSKKLVGRDNLASKDRYRYFQSITLINFEKKDKISIKGETYTIKAINNNDLVLINEKNGAKEQATYSIIKDYVQLVEKNQNNS